MNLDCDVLIIGAGPAGTSAAIQLAKLGHRLIVVERKDFPRSQVGICISESTAPLFEVLGLRDCVGSSGFWERNRTAVRWGESSTRFVSQPGYHVDRGRLDQLMLSDAKQRGVSVCQAARAIRFSQTLEHAWRVELDQNGVRREITSRFVIDASGRGAVLPGKRIADSPPLLAMHATWSMNKPPAIDGLIESGRNSWLWFARTSQNLGIVTVFCDPRTLRRCSRLQSAYERLLEQYDLTRDNHDWRQVSLVRGCDATSSHADQPVSQKHLRIGDACLSVDPLSSQGVHLAMLSGIQGALIVNTILDRPNNATLAMQFCQSRTADRILKYTRRTESEYGRVLQGTSDNFWKQRAGSSDDSNQDFLEPRQQARRNSASGTVVVSKQVAIQNAPVIEGDFIVERAVVTHPAMDNFAFVDGIAMAPLISCLPATMQFESIPEIWNDRLPVVTSRKIASWLWDKGILVEPQFA